jgi:hypothetical protein
MVRRLLVLMAMVARMSAIHLATTLAAMVVLVSGCDPDDGGSGMPGPSPVAMADAVLEPADAAAVPDPTTPEVADPPRERTDVGPRPIVLRRPWPPTSLPLALLATMGAPAPAPSRATIRDDGSGVIASYRPGDHVREDVEVLSIEDGLVELSNAGEVEYLSISEIPVELSADDVFYPDLVDELRLSGSMADGIPMPAGTEYTLKAEAFSWTTPRTAAVLRDAIHQYARGRKAPKLHIGDISLEGGGPFSPHLSHQDGRDVDIAYVLHDRGRFGVATSINLDRRHTWELLRTLLDTRAITYVFVDYEVQRMLYEHALGEGLAPEQLDPWFQYPYGRRAARGIIRHWKGHRDHFHVRFAP